MPPWQSWCRRRRSRRRSSPATRGTARPFSTRCHLRWESIELALHWCENNVKSLQVVCGVQRIGFVEFSPFFPCLSNFGPAYENWTEMTGQLGKIEENSQYNVASDHHGSSRVSHVVIVIDLGWVDLNCNILPNCLAVSASAQADSSRQWNTRNPGHPNPVHKHMRHRVNTILHLQNSTARFSTDSIMVSSEDADTASMTSSLSSPVDRFFTSHCRTSSSFLRLPEKERNESRNL